MMRRLTILLTVFALAATLLVPAASAQAPPEEVKLTKSIQIRTSKTAAVVSGDTASLTVSIRAKNPVDDVRFTATLEDGSVTYPANTVDHSGPYNGYEMDKKETDYVAFNVTVPAGVERKTSLGLELTATWTEDGKALTGTATVKVPVVPFNGDPFQVLTDTVAVTEADNGWVGISLTGLAPRVEGVQVRIVDPEGLDIYYPLETHTSLHGDDLLEDGETDDARFRVNESLWGQTSEVSVEVSYTLDGTDASMVHPVTIEG